MTSLVATPDPATGTVLVDVEQTTARDLFTRVVANSWGNATTGQAWTSTGGVATDFSVNGSQGLHNITTVNASRRSVISVGFPDMGGQFQVSIPAVATVNPIQFGLMLRHTDVANFLYVNVSIAASNVATLSLRKMVLGVEYQIGPDAVLAVPHVNGATWFLRGEVCGTMIRGKAWRTSAALEPDWILTATDTSIVTGNNIGPRTITSTGNPAIVFSYDNFFSYISQPVRLWRVTPDGVRTQVRNSPFETFLATAGAATAIATVWDGEAPFDTLITYELTSDCSTTPQVTSSAVTLLSNGSAWIRDPNNPSNNVEIPFDRPAFNTCDTEQEITFLGWDPRLYANASGIFPILNSERPTTISMRRKRYTSGFFFASKTLDDIELMESLFMPGTILLVSLPAEYGFGRPYNSDYITVEDLEQEQINTDDFRSPHRAWVVPFQLSYAPPNLAPGLTGGNGIGGGGATYADMTASAIGATYATTTATGFTYQQLAQGVGY